MLNLIGKPMSLPSPSPDALAHSQKVSQFIRQTIERAGGKIPFSEFMNLALYAPQLGYYEAGAQKFGSAGDFITSPEISPLFGRCIATLLSGDVLELGAGSGKLAASILHSEHKPERYYILEVSADLKKRQQEFLRATCPDDYHRLIWLDRLPPANSFSGMILANEVMDAFPATRFCWQDKKVNEYYVGYKQDQFAWQLGKPSNSQITSIVESLDLVTEPYHSELHLLLKPWIKSLSACLKQGLILLIDYGFSRREFYHPDRSMGTLMCHYRHHAHGDPFFMPGLQDITAHVDFTAVAEAASDNDLEVAGFATQAAFLLDCGLLTMATEKEAQAIKYLTLPSEMGELFKVIALTRDIELPLRGFQLQNYVERL